MTKSTPVSKRVQKKSQKIWKKFNFSVRVSDTTGKLVGDHCSTVLDEFYNTAATTDSICNRLRGENTVESMKGNRPSVARSTSGNSSDDDSSQRREKEIWMVGDSIHFQQFSSLLLLAGRQVTEPRTTEERTSLYTEELCDGAVKVGFIRNDHLHDPSGDNGDGRCDVCLGGKYMNPCNHINCPFWSAVKYADIIIFNRGAHWVEDEKLVEGLTAFVDELPQHLDLTRTSVIWRTTAPGHEDCGECPH